VNVSGEPEDLVKRIDDLVEPADEPENEVLTDNSRLVRWAGPLFALFALILVPWIVYLAFSLPQRELSPHYDVAWAGFDIMECAALAATAYFALRRSRYLSPTAIAAATFLVVDAWFDCMTTADSQLLESILLCFLVELPLAGVCVWLSYHTLQIAERRITLLQLRRSSGRRPARRPASGSASRSAKGSARHSAG
jgi:hypothetical protein